MEFIKNIFRTFMQKLKISYTLLMAEKCHYIIKFSLSTIFIGIFVIFIFSHMKDIALLFNNISVLFTDLLKVIGVLKEVVIEPEPEPVIEIIMPQEKPYKPWATKSDIVCIVGYYSVVGCVVLIAFSCGVPVPILGEIVFAAV